jgi:hypothetical protein
LQKKVLKHFLNVENKIWKQKLSEKRKKRPFGEKLKTFLLL